MSEQTNSALESLAVRLAREAGALIRIAYDRTSEVGHKSNRIDLVTDTDREAEAHILEGIKEHDPSHEIIAEESAPMGDAASDVSTGTASPAEVRWIVDPLDGTVNFTHRVPHFSVLIAVQRRRAGGEHAGYETVVGVVYDPMRDELFSAVRGGGCRLNDVPVAVSQTPELIDSLLATGFPYDRLKSKADNHAEFCRLNLLTRGVRRFGSAGLDLAWVACGRYDGYWEAGLAPWDLAAGALLVEEAGGIVTGLRGGPVELERGNVTCANPHLHAPMLDALGSAREHAVNSREGIDRWLPQD